LGQKDFWSEQPQGHSSVHVGDRGADRFDFFQACRSTQTHFLVRAAQNRRTQDNDEEVGSLLNRARAWPSRQSRPFEVPASHGRSARSTQGQISLGQMTLLPPRNEPRASKDPLKLWVIRVWEENPPEGEEPLEWILLTSVPTTTLEQAWERVTWYEHRWVVEDASLSASKRDVALRSAKCKRLIALYACWACSLP
jgi:hypothetical protein